MKTGELSKELAKGHLRPAYLLAGAEALLRDDALAALRSAVLAGAPEDFNLDRLEGSKTSPAALGDALRSLPVMAEHRLVVLREPDPRRGAGKGLADTLPEQVAELVAQTQTVLVVVAEKVDKRSRWVKAFADPAALVECDAPRPGKALQSFVRDEAGRQGVALEADAVSLLVEEIGPQLLLLRQEIAKAALIAEEGRPVSRAALAGLVTQVADDPIWDLTDAIGEGRRAEAVDLLGRMLRGGAPPPALLGSLASHFRKLARLRGGGEVAGPPFVRQKLERQARRYTPPRIVQCLEAIHETDLALKGATGMRSDIALERLVLGLAS